MKFKNLLISSMLCGGLLAVTAVAQAQKQTTLRDFYNNSKAPKTEKVNNQNSLDHLQLKINSRRHFDIVQPAHQSAQTQSRLKAFSYGEYDGVMTIPADSIRLFYSGSRSNPGLEYQLMDSYIYYPSVAPFVPTIDDAIHFNSDSLFIFSWNTSDDVFDQTIKTNTTFDANGKVLSEIFSLFYGATWLTATRTLYTYNTSDFITSVIVQNWSGSVWENNGKKEYTYDSQNNITEYIRSNWDNSSSSWKGTDRIIATYEGSKMISIINQWASSGTWTNSWRGSMNYAGNNLTEYYEDYWSSGSWAKDFKIVNSYNSSNQLTSEKHMYWNSGDYTNDYRVLHNYDQGVRINRIEQNWDGSNWYYNYREEYEYLNGKVNRVIASNWDGSQFQISARLNYNNNSYGQPTVAGIDEYDGSGWIPAANNTVINFYYEEFEGGVTGINEKLNNENLSIYPNPAKNFINIEWSGQNINHIKIVDITGKVVFETKSSFTSSEVQIPVEQLENGVYILHVSNGNQGSTSKFVVKH